LIRKIIDLIRRLWSIPFLRFLVVGGINTVFGYSVFALFILIGLHYALAALLATICGILFNFKTTGTLIFKNKDNRLIFRFFGVYLITYLSTIGLLKIFNMFGVSNLMAGAIIVLPMGIVSFLLMKKLVFKTFRQGLIK
jgi:putative flippase GtrA